MGNCCSLFFAVQDGALAAGESLRRLAIPRHRVVIQAGMRVRGVVDGGVMSKTLTSGRRMSRDPLREERQHPLKIGGLCEAVISTCEYLQSFRAG